MIARNLLRMLVAGLLGLNAFAQAADATALPPTASQVCLPHTASNSDATLTPGQIQLGTGIAAFDEGKPIVASERIKRALRSGLDVPIERAAAHKYLALVYCGNGAALLCRKHFEAAIAASADITFDDGELRTSLYRRSLNEAQRSHARKETAQKSTSAKTARTANVETPANAGKAAAAETGTIRLDIRPWAQVLVNNRALAISPPSKSLTLEAGQYSIEIRNPAGPPLRADVIVPVGGSIEVAHRF